MTVYLDNAATSFPKPRQVCEAVEQAMRQSAANPGRGGHRLSLEAARLVLSAREAVARFIGAEDSSRIVFTANATEAINLALFGVLASGDRAVTTTMEHNAVIRPLHALAERGVEVVKVSADQAGSVAPEALMAAAEKNARLIVMSHCSNVTGTVQAIEHLGPWCRQQGVLLLVDAAQSAGLLPIDVGEMGIDMLAASGHKSLLGPPGTGFLYVRKGLELDPLIFGGTGVLSDSVEQPREMPERLESGTLNTIGLAGLEAALRFIEAEGFERIQAHERQLLEQLMKGLESQSGVTLHGPRTAEAHGGAVSFTIPGEDPAAIGFRLDRQFDICCRTGLHCAPDAHRSIGTYPAGTIRVSPGFFNSGDDIERFLAALRDLLH